MIQSIILDLMVAFVKIVAALVLSANAAYVSMTLLDRITSQIDEWKEIKKGNAAVGILYAAVIFSLLIMVEPQISEFVGAIQLGLPAQLLVGTLAFALANYIVAVLIGVILIYLSLHVIDYLTPDLMELNELKKGNVAVALIMAAVLVVISFSMHSPFESVFNIIKSLESLLL